MSDAVITKANDQWSRRPADERFSSLAAMHAAATRIRTNATVESIMNNALRVIPKEGQLMLAGGNVAGARMTNWSFGQVAAKAKAPAGYLADLSAETAARCINEGLARNREDGNALALLDQQPDGTLTARAVNGPAYSRIWNADITARLVELEARGPWQPAPAAFDGSRGLYLGDRDMFAFLVDNERRIFEKGPGGGLSRGFFAWNSEVGDASFGLMTFLYEYVCGNHRVWGVENVNEMRIIHIGKGRDARAAEMMKVELRKYAELSAVDDEAKVLAARTFQIGATKEEVLDAVFRLKSAPLTKSIVTRAYDLVEGPRNDWYGSPRTPWGLAGGITEIARDLPNASERVALDHAAGRVMAMAA